MKIQTLEGMKVGIKVSKEVQVWCNITQDEGYYYKVAKKDILNSLIAFEITDVFNAELDDENILYVN